MSDLTPQIQQETARRLLWASSAFYILIAFEFFYMASPFAAYFYAVYGPGLDGLQQFGLSGWMLWFFLPHLVEETRSSLINSAQIIGLSLFFVGLLGFAIGAFQVYRAKIRKTGAVTGGIYRYIRHPQYAALIVASLGMLLIWPRFLVLFSTVTMIFAYVILARVEERICMAEFPDYKTFRERTGMFFPKFFPMLSVPKVTGWVPRLLVWMTAFIIVFSLATFAAFGVRHLTIASLYTLETENGIYLSITKLSDDDVARVAKIVQTHTEVAEALDKLTNGDRYIAYIVPTQMFISEIPMVLPKGQTFGHSVPRDRDLNRYKVIFARAEFPASGLPDGGNILQHAVNKHALIEAQINLGTHSVERVLAPPNQGFYPDVQVPLF